jgi:hypothetical protein
MNLFGLLFFAAIAFLLIGWLKIDFFKDVNFRHVLISVLVFGIFWISYVYLTNQWYSAFSNFESYEFWGVSKKIFILFFNYPDSYYTLLLYFRTIPVFTVVAILFISVAIFHLIISKKPSDKGIRFIAFVLILSGLMATSVQTYYTETRYTFFIFPLLLFFTIYSFKMISEYFLKDNYKLNLITFIGLLIVYLLLSEDFRTYHLINLDTEEINYRINYSPQMKKHFYRRWDVITPTDLIRKEMKDDDIIITNDLSADFYLPRIDYVNIDYRHGRFLSLSTLEGRKERWTNSRLIYTNSNLLNLMNNNDNDIWFLVFKEFNLLEMSFYQKFEKYLYFQGIDEVLKVYKVQEFILFQIIKIFF